MLDEGDLIMDGGNSRWTDSKANAARCGEKGVHFMDVGTSGGIWGIDVGYCMMVGGPDEAVQRLSPILDVLAPPDGWGHMGPAGAGHYVKMVHNGVEYGMMQAYAEGFEIITPASTTSTCKAIAHLWNQGSVVRSWLCELLELRVRAGGQRPRRTSPATCRTRARGAGRWRPRSTWPCRRRCSTCR